MRRLRPNPLLFLVMLALLVALSACQSQTATPLIRIGAHQVSLVDFRQQIRPLQAELDQLPAEQLKRLLRQALSQLIDQELLLAEVQRRRIVIDDQELQQALRGLRGTYSEKEYRGILREAGQDPAHWRQQLRIRLLSEKVASSITRGKINIDAQQVKEYYLQHLKDYQRPEQLQARQMLLSTEKQAIALRNRLLAGESFAALAVQYSLSPDHENGGNLGLFARGQLPLKFDKVLFLLTPGRVSQPVKSSYGIHLFLVEKRLEAGVLPLTEVEASIHRQLKSTEEARLYQRWLHDLREKTNVQIDWEQLDKLNFGKAK